MMCGKMLCKWVLSYIMCNACGKLFIKGKNSSICLKVNLHSQDYVKTMLIEFSLPSTCYVWFAWEGVILVIAMYLPIMKLGQLLRIEQLV